MIWARLAEAIRVGDLCGGLVETYDVDAATCERDVLTFLNDAVKEGIVNVRQRPGRLT